jgi:hypothetical protein
MEESLTDMSVAGDRHPRHVASVGERRRCWFNGCLPGLLDVAVGGTRATSAPNVDFGGHGIGMRRGLDYLKSGHGLLKVGGPDYGELLGTIDR